MINIKKNKIPKGFNCGDCLTFMVCNILLNKRKEEVVCPFPENRFLFGRAAYYDAPSEVVQRLIGNQ